MLVSSYTSSLFSKIGQFAFVPPIFFKETFSLLNSFIQPPRRPHLPVLSINQSLKYNSSLLTQELLILSLNPLPYLSVIAICSSIAEPVFAFQFPEMDVLLGKQTKNITWTWKYTPAPSSLILQSSFLSQCLYRRGWGEALPHRSFSKASLNNTPPYRICCLDSWKTEWGVRQGNLQGILSIHQALWVLSFFIHQAQDCWNACRRSLE